MNLDAAFKYNCVECNEKLDFDDFYFNKPKT